MTGFVLKPLEDFLTYVSWDYVYVEASKGLRIMKSFTQRIN